MESIERDAKERAQRKKHNMEIAIKWKEKGNKYFKVDDFSEAINCYTEAINLVRDEVTFYTNRAQVRYLSFIF